MTILNTIYHLFKKLASIIVFEAINYFFLGKCSLVWHNLKVTLNFVEDVPAPLVLKKELEKNLWDDEDVDEDDIKESWEDEEPTPVFYIFFL